jgi:DNA-binding transcriptional LysR family regulator
MPAEGVGRIERRLKLHDVRVFMAVVQAGSMNKAAENLGTSQPAVSRSIVNLEHALGVRILDRTPRGVAPTQFGRAIIRRGVAVFDELSQVVKDIEFLADPTAGELRIGCPEAVAGGPVLAIVDRLTDRHPRIRFDVVTGPAPTIFRELTARNVEVVMSPITGPVAEEHQVVDVVFDYAFVVAAGIENAWTRRRKIHLAELANEAWTLPPSDTLAGAFVIEAFRAIGLEPPRGTVVTQSWNMRSRLLATGRFLTIQPDYTLMFQGRHLSLKSLPVKLPNARASIAIVTLRNRTLSPVAELFIETARSVARSIAKSK